MNAYLYILRCADGSYYVGTTRQSLQQRVAEHQSGVFDGYTAQRRPVSLVFHEVFERIEDAVAAERQIKGWRRKKKEALIRGDYAALPSLARRRSGLPPVLLARRGSEGHSSEALKISVGNTDPRCASFETAASRLPQDEVFLNAIKEISHREQARRATSKAQDGHAEAEPGKEPQWKNLRI